jgi:hypothetical protein
MITKKIVPIITISIFFCFHFAGAVTVINGVKVDDNRCTISPSGGNFFYAMNIGIYCGSGVTAATYQWDKGIATSFTNSAVVTYMAYKKSQLVVNYKYNVTSGSKIVEKKGSISSTFDTNQNTCTIYPKGGSFTYNAYIGIECGYNVKQASWQWDNDLATDFNRSTYVQFIIDKPKKLTVNYTYRQVSGQTTTDKTGRVSQSFNIKKCADSDNGINYEQKGNVEYANNGAIKIYNDTCSGQYLTEYYCEAGALKTQRAKCSRGCADGACKW